MFWKAGSVGSKAQARTFPEFRKSVVHPSSWKISDATEQSIIVWLFLLAESVESGASFLLTLCPDEGVGEEDGGFESIIFLNVCWSMNQFLEQYVI